MLPDRTAKDGVTWEILRKEYALSQKMHCMKTDIHYALGI